VASQEGLFPIELYCTYESGRVSDGSAHLLSHALVSQSASVICCTLSLSTCHPTSNMLVTLVARQPFILKVLTVVKYSAIEKYSYVKSIEQSLKIADTCSVG
jgi:hypothetical protein